MGTGGGGIGKYDGIEFEVLTVEEGLGSNQVYCLLEDQNENIWIGTEEGGLNLYDGFKIIDIGKKIGIKNRRIWALHEDRKGNIWIGTYGDGLVRWDGEQTPFFTTKEGLNGNNIVSICEDADGIIWAGTNVRGLNRIEGNQVSMLGSKDSYPFFTSSPIIARKNGELITGSERGLWFVKDRQFFPVPGADCIQDKEITALFEARDSSLWVGIIDEGMVRIKDAVCEHFNTTNGLPSNYVYAWIEDRFGQLWIGTEGGGIARYNGAPFPLFTEKEGLSDVFIVDISDDLDGNIWFGINGGGACRFDGNEMRTFSREDGLCSNSIGSICKDQTGNLWFGSFGNGISRFDGSTFNTYRAANHSDGEKDFHVYNLTCGPDNTIWAGLEYDIVRIVENNVQYFSKEEWPWRGHLNDILAEENGTIWFTSYGNGLVRYQAGEFELCLFDSTVDLSRLLSLAMDQQGNLYIGTEGNGLWI